MNLEKKCLFYQNWEDFDGGRGIGYCNLDGNQPTCEGDIHFCETLDLLKGYSFVQKRRKEWEKRRNVHSSGSQKF
jgi:hypothetical protein